jgi:two-component system response regulator FixJ
MFAMKKGISVNNRNGSLREIRARLVTLTSRELQVMRLMVLGATSREMAAQLGISPRTIEVHRGNVMLKMDTRRVPELVRWAVSLGM